VRGPIALVFDAAQMPVAGNQRIATPSSVCYNGGNDSRR
jgi:hypothetical protein